MDYLHIQKGLSCPSVGYAQSSIYISTCACVVLCMASLFASTNRGLALPEAAKVSMYFKSDWLSFFARTHGFGSKNKMYIIRFSKLSYKYLPHPSGAFNVL